MLAVLRVGARAMTYQIGDRVFVTADNHGSPAVIIEYREGAGLPASHYKVRTDTGDEFWAFDFEISAIEEDKAK